MKIKIEQSHIDRGFIRSRFCCPIALALLDMNERAKVEKHTVELLPRKWEIWPQVYKLPEKAVKFIMKFDAGKPVEPLEFEIEDS